MAKENTASTTDQVSPVKDVEQKKPAPPAPEVSEVKPEPPVAEDPATLFEMTEGPSGPGKKDILSPENVVIPFEKINEIKTEKGGIRESRESRGRQAAEASGQGCRQERASGPGQSTEAEQSPQGQGHSCQDRQRKGCKGPQGQSPCESRASGPKSRSPGQGRAYCGPALTGSGAGRIHQAVGAVPLQKSSVPGQGR